MKLFLLLVISMASTSCITQEKKVNTNKLADIVGDDHLKIGQYVTGVYEDSKGNLWFGTIQKGIARYDGETLKYFTSEDGLPSDRVIGIIEDNNGVYWLMTGAGLSKYDGKTFTNFSVKDDFSSNTISQLLIDSKGTFWIGTWGGVFTFDGKAFNHFPLPYPQVSTPINKDTKNWITDIKEDAEGNIWIGRDGYGACKYDGKSFTHYLKKDGLHSNYITNIEFDREGNVWFGTRVAERDHPDPQQRKGNGGVNRMNNNSILSYPEIECFNNNDVHEIKHDNLGNIWISTLSNGVYRYDGKEFRNFDVPISIMGIINDRKGDLWLGGAGGLYKIKKNGDVIYVTVNGPWD